MRGRFGLGTLLLFSIPACGGPGASAHAERLAPADSHLECTRNETCEAVPGAGPDRCLDDDACRGVHLGCIEGTCDLISGFGPDLCETLGDDSECGGHHMECSYPNNGGVSGASCRLVEGVGPSTCTDSLDCGGAMACQAGSCEYFSGSVPREIRCTNDNMCTQKHSACVDGQCALVDGAGANECISWKDCLAASICDEGTCRAGLPGESWSCGDDDDCAEQHMACRKDRCVRVDGAGPNECTRRRDCMDETQTHACVDQACVAVPAKYPTPDPACSDDAECEGNHMACTFGGQCSVVPNEPGGDNEDQCAVGDDCSEVHAACIAGACEVVHGGGPDLCSWDAQCANKHLECDGQACVVADGLAPNDCLGDDACNTTMVCQSGACVSLSGRHDVTCESDVDCGGKHLACGPHLECELVDGAGTDECTTDYQCSHDTGTRCFGQACVVVFGHDVQECQRDDDCRGPVPEGEGDDGVLPVE